MDEGATVEAATATIPAALAGGQTFQVGDQILLEVVEAMEDGSLVVKYATEKAVEQEPPWEEGFRKSMSAREPQEEAV